MDAGAACALAGVVFALYWRSSGSLLSAIILALTAVILGKSSLRMQGLDWSILLLFVFEVPSLLFSQYRANGIQSSLLIALAVLMYFAVRIAIRTPKQMVFFSGLVAVGGVFLGGSGIHQFSTNSAELAEAGFTSLADFRSRLMTPPSPWLPGEWFTLLLLALPFAGALPVYLWRKNRTFYAILALLPLFLISATLCLSLSRFSIREPQHSRRSSG